MGSKKSGVRIQDDHEKEDRHIGNFYTRVYDDAIANKIPIDNTIIEQTCEVGGGRLESLARVYSSGGDGPASHQAAYAASLSAIHQQRERAHRRYAALVSNILKHEPDLQAQEKRREEGERILRRQEEEASTQEEKVERLQQLIHGTRSATAATTAKVTTYSTYKDYVELSVGSFGVEETTVAGVCGRFRDLLNLRVQLLLKVNLTLHHLHRARQKLLVFVQSEKEREGEALLQLYRERSAGWTSSRNLAEMEASLAALQTASTHMHTRLTRVRLALVNIYSVARAYQRSLPPLGPRAATSNVLKRLHNFLLDAITVTDAARTATQPASLRPSAPSLNKPTRRENAPTKTTAKDVPAAKTTLKDNVGTKAAPKDTTTVKSMPKDNLAVKSAVAKSITKVLNKPKESALVKPPVAPPVKDSFDKQKSAFSRSGSGSAKLAQIKAKGQLSAEESATHKISAKKDGGRVIGKQIRSGSSLKGNTVDKPGL